MRGGPVAVVAHPDDESLIAGGTLALAADAGATTGIVSMTRGEHGPISSQQLATREQLGNVREAELHAAAAELGVAWAACLRYPDGELPWVDHEAAAADLAELLGQHDARAVLTFAEDGLYWHLDHIAARAIAVLAVQRLGPAVELYEAAWPTGLMTQLVDEMDERGLPAELWGLDPGAFGSDRDATVALDIRAVLPRKLAAIRAHRTQIDPSHLLATVPDDLAERYLAVERWVGPRGGMLEELLADG